MTLRADRFIGNNNKLKCGPTSKPCGDACIPKNHKCRASWNKPVKAVKIGLTAGAVGLVATALIHPRTAMRGAARGLVEPLTNAGFGVGNIARGNQVQAAKNFADAALSAKNLKKNLNTLRVGYGQDVRNLGNRAKEAHFKWKHHRPAK